MRTKPSIVLAPWGMLHQGCLSIKPVKKKVYLRLFQLFGFFKRVQWHATNTQEQNDICRVFGSNAKITIADALPANFETVIQPIKKEGEPLRLATVALVAQKKGHLRVIRALKEIQNEIKAEYHIYGPVKDMDFWQACIKEASNIGSSVRVIYHGFLDPSSVLPTIQRSHFFILHSDGENFCQSIYEALAAGRPVITSDQTPWNGLEEENAGWNIQLNDFSSLKKALKEAYVMDESVYNRMCANARLRAKRFVVELNAEEQYRTLFS